MITDGIVDDLVPLGVTREVRDAALAEMAEILGDAAVHRDDALVEEFRDPYDHPEWDDHWPAAVVQPASVEEVQAVVRIASRHGVPLWTNSQAKNNGYGGAAPRLRGSITVNLRRMNRILEVNEELGYVVVEPGVTFYELVDELARRGGDWWPSTPDLGWGSVVGNTVDHGVGYTEFGDHAASVSGMEIVLPDGELLRTGMWASSTSAAAHVHPRGFGPDIEGLFMQSNLGIVTKLGRRVSPRPEVYAPLRFHVPEKDDLAPLVEAARTLLLEGTIRNIPVIGGILGTAAMRAPRTAWLDGPLTDDEYRRVADELDMGWWNLRAALYGPARVVEAQLARCEEVLRAAVPAGRFSAIPVAGTDVDERTIPLHPDRVQAGRPSQALLKSIEWRGPDGGHIELSPVGALTGEHVVRVGQILREEMEASGFDFWPSICLTPRSFIYLGVINFDRSDPERIRAAYDLYERAVRRLGGEGYPVYRGHLRGMDAIADQFDWNDHAYRRFVQGLKDAVDPAGILSPGKQGIWPQRLR
ncbi:FAD-binding oxidoreductase [Microbacterium sp. NPDC096154]|uniref:FAD-binding oxidoreductase n=1 Tax=Microbacterium sp. NPDC096154 TaxID=3155549 RepID=UPI003332B4A1